MQNIVRPFELSLRSDATKLFRPSESVVLGITSPGPNDCAIAVRVHDPTLLDSTQVHLIRQATRGEVDIRYIGAVQKQSKPWYQNRSRPPRIGCSTGHNLITAGTLGAFVVLRSGMEIAFVSNNHVLANEGLGKRGDYILQPASLDGGLQPDDVVGTLAEFIPLLRQPDTNLVDCAVAVLTEDVGDNTVSIDGFGKLTGISDISIEDARKVVKLGRTTGLTYGRVTAVELDNLKVHYGMGDLIFNNQIEIESLRNGPFSSGGDSGSVIVDENGGAIGLLFAASQTGGTNGSGLTYANPIRTVLERLDISLIT